MRALNVDDTPVDLAAKKVPFLSNYTAVVLNGTTSQLVLQHSDDNSSYTTLATVPAGAAAEVVLSKRYIKVSTAATLVLLGN